jgi:hypothetical protein
VTDIGLPPLFTREQAHGAGLTDRQLDRLLSKGALVAVRRGVLCQAAKAPAAEAIEIAEQAPKQCPQALPVDLEAALLASPSRDLVVSHLSAARLHGLPKPLAGWPMPQFTATSGPTRRRRGVHVLVSSLVSEDVVDWHGAPVTSPARTVADCLRTMPGRDALAVADSALHRGITSELAVLEVLRRQAGWRGVSLARQVFALADPRRESPLESWSAWAFAYTGVPTPQWQVEIREADGLLIGRGDCWWPGGVVGEADGRSKYALAAAERGGGALAAFEVLQAERRREQRMRDVGAEIVRWSAGEVLKEPAARLLSRRISAAIAVALDSARFTGVVAQPMLPLPTAERANIATDGS